MNAIVYEVRLTIDPKIRNQFLTWLDDHVGEMLSFDGFLDAHILLGDNAMPNEISVHYTLESAEFFEHYEREHALRMRAEGLKRFPEGLEATRRIWQIRRPRD